MHVVLSRLARRLASSGVTSREELEALIEGQPTAMNHSKQQPTMTTPTWIWDGNKVDTNRTTCTAAYLGATATVEVMLVATALSSCSNVSAAGGGFVKRIGTLAGEALKATAMWTGPETHVAERLMSVVRWRSRQQQQQQQQHQGQQAHEQADGVEAVRRIVWRCFGPCVWLRREAMKR